MNKQVQRLSLIQQFKEVNRDKFPIVRYLDYQEKVVKGAGYSFSTYEYPTQLNPKAILYYIPDHGECCLNMGYFFKKFAGMGVRVYSFDRKGFGMS